MVLTDSLLRQSARFCALIGVVLYGLNAASTMLTMSRFPGGSRFLADLFSAAVFLGAAAALAFGVHRSRRRGDALPVVHMCLLAAAVIGAYWLMGGPASPYQETVFMYALAVAPALLSGGLGTAAWLSEKALGTPLRRVAGVPANPYPWMSTVFAVALYAPVCLVAALAFAFMSDGTTLLPGQPDPAPAYVQAGVLGLCLPFVLVTTGFAASLSGRVRTSAPIFATGAISLVTVLVATPQAFQGIIEPWPVRWMFALLLATPLVWPVLHAWKGTGEQQKRRWFGY